MLTTHLRNIDLNLLGALSALLEERSVTEAARKIGLSQPAMSRSLGRLRKLFNDELIVRTTKGNLLTPHAETLKPELEKIMQNLALLLEKESFDPVTTEAEFTIAVNDYAGSVILPGLLKRFREHNYNIKLIVRPNNRTTLTQIENGEIDLAIASFPNPPSSFFKQLLFEDSFVCILRTDHPALKRRMTLKQYIALSHLVVSLDREGVGPVDTVLTKQKLKRKISTIIPFFSAAPAILQASDLILTIPRYLANQITNDALKIIPPPFSLPALPVSQIWHPRLKSSAAHSWLRNYIKDCMAEKRPA